MTPRSEHPTVGALHERPLDVTARDKLEIAAYQAEVLALITPDSRQERVALRTATGRVLAESLHSAVSLPGFANSAMDGFAVRFADLAGSGMQLRVVADIPAGSSQDPAAGPGECVRIMTGAAVPSFADTVIPVEDVDQLSPTLIAVRVVPQQAGRHVRGIGEDVGAGDLLGQAGDTVDSTLIGALAATGVTEVPVRPRPVIAVCATGDELVWDGSALERGQLYESNSAALAAALAADGAEVRWRQPLPDRAADLTAWLDEVASGSDLVVLTGGASVGAYDVVHEVLAGRAAGVFRRVNMRPGKPQGWARWPHGSAVLALPGNPVAAALSYRLFVRPLLNKRLGRPERPAVMARAATGWTTHGPRTVLVPVTTSVSDSAVLEVRPTRSVVGSHLTSSLVGADAFAIIPGHIDEVAPGELVEIRWL